MSAGDQLRHIVDEKWIGVDVVFGAFEPSTALGGEVVGRYKLNEADRLNEFGKVGNFFLDITGSTGVLHITTPFLKEHTLIRNSAPFNYSTLC